MKTKARPSKLGDYEKLVIFHVWSKYVIHVVFSHNIFESYKMRYPGRSLDRDLNSTHAFHAVSRHPGGHAHLFFKIGDAPAGVVAHECFHAIRELFGYSGVEQHDNEMYAYHLGYLVQEVSNYLYALIDSGVKSKTEVKPNEHASGASQGVNANVCGLQPGPETKAGTQAAQNHKRCYA